MAMEMEITFPGGSRVDARFGGYEVRTDQPARAGGEGSAPTPFDTFLASIGTCAGIYVLGFCRERELPTDGIRIVQRVETDPATKLVTRIEIEIRVPASFPAKYYPALVRVADQCKVKKHLESPPRIEVATVAAA